MHVLLVGEWLLNINTFVSLEIFTAKSRSTLCKEPQDRKPLCPPPLTCLDSQHSSTSPALDLVVKTRIGSSTSTPIDSNKIPSKGGLIRPIPSRLGSPFSPVLTPGMVPANFSSSIFASPLGSPIPNSFPLQIHGEGIQNPSLKKG